MYRIFTVLKFALICIGNIVVGVLISQYINDKIYEICRYIAGETQIKDKDKDKKLSLPEGVKILSFIFKWKSRLSFLCWLLFFVIGCYLFSGWYTFIFIIMSINQLSESIKDFNLSSNNEKIENMVRCGLLFVDN